MRLDSLLTLRDDQSEEDPEVKDVARQQLEVDIKQKLTELHLRLKNGGSVHDRHLDPNEEDEEDEAVEDSQGPSSANEGGAGSVDCVGCSSAEDENCPSPIQPQGEQRTACRQCAILCG